MSTQLSVGINEGLKHDSSVHFDELISMPKSLLKRYVGRLDGQKLRALDLALAVALDIECDKGFALEKS